MTEEAAIRLVVFDMDGVLDRYDLAARLARLAAATGKSAEVIHAAIWKSGFEDAADAGKFSAEEYLAGFGARIGAPLTRHDWVAARRAAMHPNRDVLELAGRLKRRAAIAVLTNNGFLVKDAFDELFPELPPLFGEGLHVAAEFGEEARPRSLSPPRRPPRDCADPRDDDRRQAGKRRRRRGGGTFRPPLHRHRGAAARIAGARAPAKNAIDKAAAASCKAACSPTSPNSAFFCKC